MRKVRQYHFTTWPDMGLPHDPNKVVNFVKLVKEYNPKNVGPMIVHCRLVISPCISSRNDIVRCTVTKRFSCQILRFES